MPTDGDKIAAATLAAALFKPIDPSGEAAEDARRLEDTVQFAVTLYRRFLGEVGKADEAPAA